ncbi:unnamed protein product, partial [marine sediment metagenome]
IFFTYIHPYFLNKLDQDLKVNTTILRLNKIKTKLVRGKKCYIVQIVEQRLKI